MSPEDLYLTDLLRQTRERRGETLDQIHQATGISLRVLRGLEEGDFSVIEPVYMRLAASSCGQYLGLDPDLVLELYDAASGHSFPDRVPVRTQTAPAEVAITSGEAFPKPSPGRVDLQTRLKTLPPAQMIIAVAVLAAIAFLIYALLSDSAPSPSTASASPKVEETPGVDAQPPAETVAMAVMETREPPPVAAESPRVHTPTPAAESPDAAPGDAPEDEAGAQTAPAAPFDEPTSSGPTSSGPTPGEPSPGAPPSVTAESTESTPAGERDDTVGAVDEAPVPAAAPESPAAVVTLLPSASADTDSVGVAALLGEAAIAPLVLSVHALDSTWVQVFWDGVDGVTETIPQGEDRSWQASEFFMVRAGRAHGVHFTFLGELLGDGRLGEATKVLRFRASRDAVVLLGPDQNPLTPFAQVGDSAASGGLAQP